VTGAHAAPVLLLVLLSLGCPGTGKPAPPRDDAVHCLEGLDDDRSCRRWVIAEIAAGRGAAAARRIREAAARLPHPGWVPEYLLGEIAFREGDLEAARTRYRTCLERAGRDPRGRSRCLNRLGWLAWAAGKPAQARSLLEDAEEEGARAGDPILEAIARANLAGVERAGGHLEAARKRLVQALRVFRAADDLRSAAACRGNLGEVLRQMGRLREARTELQAAADAARRLGDTNLLAHVQIDLGLVSLDARDPARARQVLLAAGRTAREARNPALARHAAILAAVARLRGGDPSGALDELQALDNGAAPREPALRLRRLLYTGEAARRAGLLDRALRAFREAEALARELDMAEEEWEAAAGEGAALLAAGNLREATVAAQRAVHLVEKIRVAIPPGRERTRLLHARVDAYALLARCLAADGGPGAPARVLEVVDAAHARALREALAGGAEPPAHPLPGMLDPARLRRHLRPDETVIEYLLGEEASIRVRLDGRGIRVTLLPSRARIEELVVAWREALARPVERWEARADPRGDLRAHLAAGRELAGLLLPADAARTDGTLWVVPDGALHLLPFSTLPVSTGDAETRFLGQVRPVAVVPAAALLPVGPSPPAAGPVIVAADARAVPALRLPALRHAEEEASAVASAWHEVPVVRLRDPVAIRRVLTGEGPPGARLLHLVAHAILRGGQPRIILATPGTGTPLVVDAGQVARGGNVPPLVILSACRTGEGEPVGGEGLLGLVRSLTLAGARTVVASLWPVDDRATSRLMGDFHRALVAGLPAERALHMAQDALSREGDAHPFAWGAFVVYRAEGKSVPSEFSR